MAGILSADRIIESEKINQKLQSIGQEVSKLITAFDKVAESGDKLAKSLGGADNLNKIIKASKDTSKATEELTFNQAELAKQHQELGKVTARLEEIQSKYNKEIIKAKELIKQKNAAIKEEITGEKAASEAKKKAAEASKQKAIEDKKAAQATKLAAQEEKLKLSVQAQSEGSIRRLQAENKLHAFTIKNKLNPAIASERAEILRLNQVIGTNKDAISDMQRKNVTAWERVTKAVWQHLAAYIGFQQLIQIIKNVFTLTRELDSLSFSMKTVIKDQKELAQTQQFLADTAQNYGLDLLTISERYIKFRAAAIQSNITAKQTMQIFNSMAKAAAVLGLKTDEVSGVFLALEQMISKGKVTTEELRRQLGERLPGAFGIMADALDVSLVKLDKMLKAGTILSAEALPKFAVALEKAYGIESVNKINTLAAAQGRLKTSWVEFVDEVNQSQTFIAVINKATGAINDIRYAFGLTDELQKYSAGFDDISLSVQKVISVFNKWEDVGQNNYNKYKKLWVQSLEAEGIREGLALKLFDQYIKKRRSLFSEQNEVSKKTVPFDVSGYKKSLDDAQNEFESFNTTNDKDLKSKILDSSSYIKDGITETTDYLKSQAKLMKDNSEKAYKQYAELEKKKQDILKFNKTAPSGSEKKITKEDQVELQARYENYQNYVDARIELDKRLNKTDIIDKKTAKTKLQLTKESSDQELFIFQQSQKKKLAEEVNTLDELYSNRDKNARDSALYEAALNETEYNNKKQTIDKQIELQSNLLKIVKGNKEEEAKITTDIEKLKQDQISLTTDFEISQYQDQIKIRRANNKQEKAESETLSNELLAQVEENTHEQSLAILDAAQKEILASKGKANKIKAIEDQLTLDLIDNEREKLQAVLDTGNLTVKDAEQVQKRINNLEESYKNKEFDVDKETEDKKADLRQQTIEKTVELLNEGFNFASKIYDSQLSKAEETYKSEIDAAGSNLTEKIIAERKYEKEINQIRKRQAIAEKAQAAMNIALSTAQAIISIWAQVPKFDFGVSAGVLTGLVAGIGALQLATVLATPVPTFYKGTSSAPETFIAGDTPDGKGASEIIHTKSGLDVLTPAKATLFSDPMFKGATIFPHDKTQEMLNSYAINGGSQVFVDMSGSEKYLNQIAQNTKNNEISG
ncbi:MAG: tape measure protein, partial [Melioribacteraceae bacterium]